MIQSPALPHEGCAPLCPSRCRAGERTKPAASAPHTRSAVRCGEFLCLVLSSFSHFTVELDYREHRVAVVQTGRPGSGPGLGPVPAAAPLDNNRSVVECAPGGSSTWRSSVYLFIYLIIYLFMHHS